MHFSEYFFRFLTSFTTLYGKQLPLTPIKSPVLVRLYCKAEDICLRTFTNAHTGSSIAQSLPVSTQSYTIDFPVNVYRNPRNGQRKNYGNSGMLAVITVDKLTFMRSLLQSAACPRPSR